VLDFKFVLWRGRIGIAANPELLDEGVALVLGLEFEEYIALLWRDNPHDILFEPALVIIGPGKLLPQERNAN
jgi:hypothetical protein